jgi:hypothetical protein
MLSYAKEHVASTSSWYENSRASGARPSCLLDANKPRNLASRIPSTIVVGCLFTIIIESSCFFLDRLYKNMNAAAAMAAIRKQPTAEAMMILTLGLLLPVFKQRVKCKKFGQNN